jgi:choline dehydrogenase-like flavoprotein
VSAFAAQTATATADVGAHLYARTSERIPAPDHEVIISAWATGLPDVLVGRGFSLHTALVRPQSRGRLALTSTDRDAPRLIDPGYLSEPGDLATLCAAVEKCGDRRITGANGSTFRRSTHAAFRTGGVTRVREEQDGYLLEPGWNVFNGH